MFRRIAAIAVLCLAALIYAAAPAMAAMSAADREAIAKHELTLDELHRMEAIVKEAGPDQEGLNLMGAPSLDDMVAQINAQPALKAILDKHDMPPRDFLVATFSLLGAAMADSLGTTGGNPANVDFYRQHKAEIDAYMDMGDDDGDDFADSDDGEDMDDLASYDGEKMGECLKVGMVPVALLPLSMPGTVATTPQQREDVAKAVADFYEKVKAENIRKDITIMSDEIRRQAHNKRMVDTPQFTGALNDVKAWLETNCSKEALKK
jgi:hypothetical protein